MRTRSRWWWGIALIPVTAGLVVATLLADVGTLPNPIISVRVDLGTLALMGGLALSILVATGVVAWEVAEWQHRQRAVGIRAQAAEERRRFLQRLDHELKNPLPAIRAGLANVVNGPATGTQREALASVSDTGTKIAVINALGYRAELKSTYALAGQLTADDESVAIAAAQALGKVATPVAARAITSPLLIGDTVDVLNGHRAVPHTQPSVIGS